LLWSYDDTLIGAGAGGTDLVILVMPELAVPKPQGGSANTNIFAGLTPNNASNFVQYTDQAAPREILSPMAGGATDFVTEWRLTSGWPVRGVSITLISMPFS
jgi:hypothetical protein